MRIEADVEIRNDVHIKQTVNLDENQNNVDNEPVFSNSMLNEFQFDASFLRFRVENTQVAALQTPPTQNGVDMEKVERVFDTTIDADYLAVRLSDEFTYLNDAEKAALLAMVVRSDRAQELLTFHSPSNPPNHTYDAQKQIATALGEAYNQGIITDADLRNLAERLGNDEFDSKASERFVMMLAQDPNNLKSGGIMEAYGQQAEALGQDQAAALAFSSSEELIRNNLNTPAERQAAFDQVKAFLESEPMNRVPEFRYGASPMLQSAYVQALTNAARLHSWFGVSTDEEFDAMLEAAGPRYVQEAIARSSQIEGDDASNSALNEFGDAARRIAQKGGDEQHDWNVNAALAYTQSEALIKANLTTPEQRLNAFDLLNHELAGSRDTARDAAEDGYSLLRAPAMAEGLAELLTAYPDEILDNKLGANGKNYEGQADLINLLQSTVFSPYTSEATRNKIQTALESYVQNEVNSADNDSQIIGNRLGSLLGVIQAASQQAINAAKKPEEAAFIDKVSKDFAKTILKAGVSTLLKGSGPVGSLVGGFVLDQVLDKIFEDKKPSPEELGEAYIDLLEENGQNISLGESLRDQYIELLTSVITSLNELRDGASGEDLQNNIDASFQVQQLLNGIRDGFGEAIDSYQLDNGQLNRALDNWSDNYKEQPI